MPTAIDSTFADLDAIAGQLPLPAILDWLRKCSLSIEQLGPYLVFSPQRYVRNRLHDGPGYQLSTATLWTT